MYCYHCGKAGHSDADCWSTRVVDGPERKWFPPATQPPSALTPPFALLRGMTDERVREIVREELARLAATSKGGAAPTQKEE